jgi:hypothetical protein
MVEKQDAISPLADPVVGEIFDGVENAEFAAETLISSILAEDGVKIGKVIALTPHLALMALIIIHHIFPIFDFLFELLNSL